MPTDATATVELLSAEVRVLMVGNRQVTLSVYRQLDVVKVEAIEPFGRVRSGEKWIDGYGDEVPHIGVVGRVRDGYRGAGALARARVATQRQYGLQIRPARCSKDEWAAHMAADAARDSERAATVRLWRDLPLIVLAGLR